MRSSLFALVISLCFGQLLTAQVSHLSLIHDFEGEDFDYSVQGMYGANDSLYVISYTPDRQGMFFRIDEQGGGFQVIWKFDNVNYEPFSIVGTDTAIYITTHATPALFKYSLRDYSFKLVKVFDWVDVQAIQIKYVTDSVFWFTSQGCPADKGSVFTTDKNGNNLTKIYTATSYDMGTMPADLFFHSNKMYIACWGGGNKYANGDGTFTYCGNFIRLNTDGSGYENIIPGSSEIGTQPQSIVIRGGRMFGLFAYGGNGPHQAHFFSSNLDGTDYQALGSLPDRALTRLLSTDSLIYGVSATTVFGINPSTGEIRISEDLLSNPDFGADVVSHPAYLNGHVYITAQQGGPNGGGTILKWTNESPDVNIPETSGGRRADASIDLDLNALFIDPNGDQIAYTFQYDQDSVTVTESNGVLALTANVPETVTLAIIARDGWTGYSGVRITLNPFTIEAVDPRSLITRVDEQEQKFRLLVYPNPAQSLLRFNTSNIESVDIIGADGKIYASFSRPGESIDISTLHNGFYFVRSTVRGKYYVQKLVKQ
jgi:hypothetical protein